MNRTELIAYTDASYDEKRNIAGWGVVIQVKKGGVTKEHTYRNFLPCPNNNYAELFAIHQALILLAGNKYRKNNTKITVYTDSQTALDYINGLRGKEYEDKHKQKWSKSQWINHKQMQLLAYKVRKLCVGSVIEYKKVKGHCKDFGTEHLVNNLADGYAKIGRSLYYKRVQERMNGRTDGR